MVWCDHCFNDCLAEFEPKNGYISCTDCGKILDDVDYYDGQDEGEAPFSAKDTSDTVGRESCSSEGSKGLGEGHEITRYQAVDRPDSKTGVLSDTSSDEEDNLSDIDDAEVNGYLHNEKEMRYKAMIWKAMNKEYLKEKAAKVAVAAVAKKSDASKKLTKERKSRGSDIAPGRSTSEATDKVVDRKRNSSKINYEALNKLMPTGVGKKPKTAGEGDEAAKDENDDYGYLRKIYTNNEDFDQGWTNLLALHLVIDGQSINNESRVLGDYRSYKRSNLVPMIA